MRSKLDIERSEICLHPPEKISDLKEREHQGAPLPRTKENTRVSAQDRRKKDAFWRPLRCVWQTF